MEKLRQISLPYFFGQDDFGFLTLAWSSNVRENKLGGGKIVLADIFNLSFLHDWTHVEKNFLLRPCCEKVEKCQYTLLTEEDILPYLKTSLKILGERPFAEKNTSRCPHGIYLRVRTAKSARNEIQREIRMVAAAFASLASLKATDLATKKDSWEEE